MASLTTAYTSGDGELRMYAQKYGFDELIVEPDFTSLGGCLITARIADKSATAKLAQGAQPDTTLQKLHDTLQEAAPDPDTEPTR
jgi:hypothetical protein